MKPLDVRLAVFADGERMPYLCHAESGLPAIEPALFLLTCRRLSGLASNTLSLDATAIKHLYLWASNRQLDLVDRFAQAKYLTLPEVDDLASALSLRYDALRELGTGSSPTQRFAVRLFPAQPSPVGKARWVNAATAVQRLTTACAYLEWLASLTLQAAPEAPQYSAAKQRIREMVGWLRARTPPVPAEPSAARQGLASNEITRLNALVDPTAADNPWATEFARRRNYLIVRLLEDLGIRRGELLGLQIDAIDFRSNQLSIRRNPDDPADPRPREPNSKTRARALPISQDLSRLLHEFILNFRSKLKAARKHFFLITTASGEPLSSSAYTKIFAQLRHSDPSFLSSLSGHILRHSWNDRYSEEMDRKAVPEGLEVRTRSYLMGWSEQSGTAQKYTRRSTKKAAAEISLRLQQALAGSKSETPEDENE